MSTLTWPQGRVVKLAPRANQPSISLTVHETGEGPAVVFCHGFPELAYSWRHQLPAVAHSLLRSEISRPRERSRSMTISQCRGHNSICRT
jgi:pimeloyl-ACP methyl ester carboxylesterase